MGGNVCDRCGNCCKEYVFDSNINRVKKISKLVTIDDILKINRFMELTEDEKFLDELKKIQTKGIRKISELEKEIDDHPFSSAQKEFLKGIGKDLDINQIFVARNLLREKPFQSHIIRSKEFENNVFELLHESGYCAYYLKDAGDGLPGCGIHIVKPNACLNTPIDYNLCSLLFNS
ncbi:MAG: hypothetical protein OH319_03070 [Candidatus Parvarchaeota archaeon]|nr:hypothetical protein [Candidatus Jingweiarchaeum tengchongense]MCW1298476.1 hypothetical protein [Candidatus Jingweiarchaeum tengchongense]MCW1300278.1 hypothetical protein [Candidatus Jingweiarchaeum tengchongense]MCW1304487.1 hypothetical protein [Candidatus Jingweiarchaeum tengchongense]MCW1310160.1 hypothetical protein [Candidatus Jingweiarchaeum tengchongense]